MAAISSNRPAPFGAITVYRIASGLVAAGQRLVAWNNARTARNALSKLSDRELADIGLSRADLDNFVSRRV